jgi:capsular exopolysaccharide synthesis family protein
MIMGVGLVLLLRLMDRSVRNLVQGEQVFSLPGLAAVPDAPAKHPIDRLITSPSTTPETAEAFRAMRASLSLLGKGITARSFLFTSPGSGDGKSYCASNFAITLAHQGYRTLLIDADLRKPALDLILLGRRNPSGLITHLQGGEDKDDGKACTPTSIPNLYLFSAGESGDAHPAELLSGQAFRDLIDDAFKWFHRVVIDTPPVNAVTDALLLAREVDSVAMVIRSGKTTRSDTRHAISKLAMAGARPVGFILNGATKEALSTGYTGDYNHAMLTPLTQPMLALPSSSASKT